MLSHDNLLLSFLITWGIGLLPILIIRFLIVRRPIGKLPAGFICLVFFIFNVILFEALGSQSKTHGALMLVSFVSFYILRYNSGTNIINDGQETAKRAVKPCKYCGAKNKLSIFRNESSPRCIICGGFLEYKIEKENGPEVVKEGKKMVGDESDLGRPTCTDCETENEVDAKFCRKCGKVLHESNEETAMYCEKCGLEYGSDDSFCQKDGTKLLPKKSSK